MIEKLLAGVVPVMLAKVAQVPISQKKAFAQMLTEMCRLYIQDEKPTFQLWLSETTFPDDWKAALTKALWSDENQGK